MGVKENNIIECEYDIDEDELNKPIQILNCLNEELMKEFENEAKKIGIEFIVHLGVYTSRNDFIPHFSWHDLIECYLKSSGIPYANIHPNVITESVLVTKPSIKETHCINTLCGDAKQGWVCTKDISYCFKRRSKKAFWKRLLFKY